MYFDNISNAELNKLPKEYMPNFNIKLSVALTHDLFKVEEIVDDTIYRVYPLFNCKTIQSSNPNDRIFENRLIICTKKATETYLTFISNEEEPVQDFNDMGSYFDIGDGLSTAQYNDIVQLERMYNTIHQPLHIQTDLITNNYGVFDFKFSGLILDNGIAISSLTNLKVKLSNPAFSHSTYTLQLKVLRIENTNIEEATENKTIIPITITLKNGKYVNIPISDLEVGDVILFDCDLIITHDIPTLNVTVLDNIDFTASKTIATAGETISLTATLYDNNGIEMPDVPVTFNVYQDGSIIDTLTGTTDSNGEVTKSYTCAGGDINVVATALSMDSETIDITVNTISTTLSINVPALVYSDIFDVTGVLKDGSANAISGASVKLYMEHNGETTLQATETTDSNGEVTFHRSAPTTITHYKFWLVFDGTALYSATQSGYEERDVNKETSVLTVTLPSDNSSYPFGVNVGVMGTLLSNDGEAITNANIVVSENNTTLTTLTTSNNGGFSGNISGLVVGNHTLKFTYAGDTYYTGCIVDNRSITINAVSSVALTVSAYDKNGQQISSPSSSAILSYVDEDYGLLTAIAKDGANNVVPSVTVSFDIVEDGVVVENIGTDVTDEYGVASVTYQSKHSGSLNIRATCNNVESSSVNIVDAKYGDASSSTNLSRYTKSGTGSITYDSTNSAYLLDTGNTAWQWTHFALPNTYLFENTSTIKAKVKFLTDYNTQFAIGLKNSNQLLELITFASQASTKLIIAIERNSSFADVNYNQVNAPNLATGVWYDLEVVYTASSYTVTLKDGNTTIGTTSLNSSSLDTTNNTFVFVVGLYSNQQVLLKDITIL